MDVQLTPMASNMAATSGTAAVATSTGSKCVFLDHNSSLKKTKRKRTSAQDQVTLENAYLKNSKPDKGERAVIVSQVDLTEKEVQIWFQNRRQNDRRRSKPLQDHEIEAHIGKSSVSPTTPTLEDQLRPTPSPITEKSPAASIDTVVTSDLSVDVVAAGSPKEQMNTSPSRLEAVVEAATPPNSGNTETDAPLSSESARKRGHAEMVTGNSAVVKMEPTKSKEPLKRASSMRLAMTADGAVKIRTSNSPTPSPPKQRIIPPSSATKRTKITRSISMFEDGQTFRDPASSEKLGRIKPNFGRSRDARTWEFYCDNGSKDNLSDQAEAQRKGSAVGAIKLIRSSSAKARAALSPVPGKGNTKPLKSSKPKMVRAQSSLARLQAGPAPFNAAKGDNAPPRRPRGPSNSTDGSDNDSDKENWMPGTRLSDHPLRRSGASRLEPFVPVLAGSGATASPGPSQQASRIGHAGSDGRVLERSPVHSRKAPTSDLDVVQSLLSLSQGAWR